MSTVFPKRFTLAALQGPRAEHFTSREDAFQQLVGDGLMAEFGSAAIVGTTEARDSGIDAFVQETATLRPPFDGMKPPVILECKDHDDMLPRLSSNIDSAWRKVERGLTANAEAGWPGAAAYWKQAHSYAYCISSRLTSPTVRLKLEDKIGAFFQSLPQSERPPIDHIRVLDWSQLRAWLNALPLVVEGWLGLRVTRIVPHQQYLSRLSGFRKYLASANLRFVPPREGDLSHPIRLVDDLLLPREKPGVVLNGPGGVGKTRTCLEVAEIAAKRGWAVLHVDPSEPTVTADDLIEAIIPQRRSTLLVFDYIDQMANFDLGLLRQAVLPQALEHGVTVSVLANSRPGWMRTRNAERDELFVPVAISTSATQQMEITEAIISAVAPQATAKLGRIRLIELCGTRPIIALLIARELERRVRANELVPADLLDLRRGDLVIWLRKRLAEDSLTVPDPPSNLVLPTPQPAMVAAATVFACSPGSEEFLMHGAESAYRALLHARPGDAAYLVHILKELGWLELSRGRFVVAHDVVADEVLDQVLHDGEHVRNDELAAVLAYAFRSPRSLGRLSLALRRVIGGIADAAAAEALEQSSTRWLRTHAQALGRRLPHRNPSSISAALTTLISGPPFASVAFDVWESLVGPWLNVQGMTEDTGYFLARASTVAPSGALQKVVDASLRWLSANIRNKGARFVISSVLVLDGLTIVTTRKIIKSALAWLGLHHKDEEASFLLHRTFERRDLSPTQTQELTRLALRWLRTHHLTADAEFVLHPLLEQAALRQNEVADAVHFALEWLRKFWHLQTAGFVLPALLRRTDLDGHQSEEAVKLAISWLDKYVHTVDAEFVLRWLLRRGDVPPPAAEQLVRSSVNRLGQRLGEAEASFLLRSTLQRRVQDPVLAADVLSVACDWLYKNRENSGADFVFNRVLRRSDLGEHQWRSVAEIALGWFRTHKESAPHIDHAVNSVLSNPRWLSDEDLQFVVSFALDCDWEGLSSTGAERLITTLKRVHRMIAPDNPLRVRLEKFLAGQSSSSFDEVLTKLRELSAMRTRPEPQFIVEACNVVAERARQAPGVAGFAVPFLLFFGSGAEGTVLPEVGSVVAGILSDSRLSTKAREKIRNAFDRLAEQYSCASSSHALSLLQIIPP